MSNNFLAWVNAEIAQADILYRKADETRRKRTITARALTLREVRNKYLASIGALPPKDGKDAG